MSFKNTFGNILQVHTFGESHGLGLGVIIDGLPSGLDLNNQKINQFLSRRRPGQNEFVTDRQEKDSFEILSGVFEGKTLGTPLSAIFRNIDCRSQDYPLGQNRKGHGDESWRFKFSHIDHRGGGRSSGRETISRVFAGSVARQLLERLTEKTKIMCWVDQVGELKNERLFSDFESEFLSYEGLQQSLFFPDIQKREQLENLLQGAKKEGESYGGVLRLKITQAPKGLGQPVFHKLKADLAAAFFSVGAVQGVLLGEDHVCQKGTFFHQQENPYGGIQGGISTGYDIDFQILLKPTSSILDVAKKGRHDPCILPRAVVVMESMACLVLADHILWSRLDNL